MECDGMEYALWEVDEELTKLIPYLRRRVGNRCMIESGADHLLDTRNYLVSIASELAIDNYEELMQ